MITAIAELNIEQNGFQYSRSEFEEVTCCGATTEESSKAHTCMSSDLPSPVVQWYVATLREKLEKLAEEKTPDGLPRVSKATINEYSEQIEAIAAKLVIQESHTEVSEGSSGEAPFDDIPTKAVDNVHSLDGLRRRIVSLSMTEDKSRDTTEDDQSTPVKLDAATQTHIQKHRKLQEDLTDEMVGLARELKERSLLMSQSVRNTERILDSTEKAIEHSLASTGHANTRAGEVYCRSSKTSCFTWLMMFAMTVVFIMVVLLIRVT